VNDQPQLTRSEVYDYSDSIWQFADQLAGSRLFT